MFRCETEGMGRAWRTSDVRRIERDVLLARVGLENVVFEDDALRAGPLDEDLGQRIASQGVVTDEEAAPGVVDPQAL
jgi:hypothetical protein